MLLGIHLEQLDMHLEQLDMYLVLEQECNGLMQEQGCSDLVWELLKVELGLLELEQLGLKLWGLKQ